jgi:hypothetical protein
VAAVPVPRECRRKFCRDSCNRNSQITFLLGLGWEAKRIAEDPIICSTPNNVHRQAQRFGLDFRAAAAAHSLRLPPEAATHFEEAAAKRSLTRESMIGHQSSRQYP